VSLGIQEVLQPCIRKAGFKRLLDSQHKGAMLFLTEDIFTTLTTLTTSIVLSRG